MTGQLRLPRGTPNIERTVAALESLGYRSDQSLRSELYALLKDRAVRGILGRSTRPSCWKLDPKVMTLTAVYATGGPHATTIKRWRALDRLMRKRGWRVLLRVVEDGELVLTTP